MKRIVFMGSLARQLNHGQLLTAQELDKINQILGLASDPRSMELGVELSHLLWTEPGCKGLCVQLAQEPSPDRSRLQQLIESVYEHTPTQLRYGCPSTMTHDVDVLISHRHQVLH